MSRQSIKVEIEPITGEEREAIGSQDLSQGVDHPMSHVLGAGTELKHRQNLGARVDRHPQPEHVLRAAQPGSQFIQLEVREVQMGEEAHVQGVRVLASTRQPGGDGRLSKAEDPRSCGRVEPFGQRREHHGDLVRGSFQSIQGRIAPGSEGGAASLTAKRLDQLGLAMRAISHQGVEVRIGVPEVRTLLVRTGEALGEYAFGGSSPAFDLAPGAYWSRPSSRQGSGGMSTDGAIVGGARLEQTMERFAHRGRCSGLDKTRMGPAKGTQERQREDEHDHEQVHMQVQEEST